ncbi:hypothetical protein GH714_001867 [Hevea brasiliensis]|uniref:Protein kinase domain-containing protein n=1 Tax=Hevea brasiliensis TaxID=3981 RepID=A0A6A6M964_HEVBR|nr:hypothetical protein GH714_001867 [Hevea brasiliensis]
MDWVRGKCLVKGSYGSVFLARPTNIISPPLAVKFALIINSFSLQKELKILFSLSGSEGVIQCYGDCLSHKNGMTIYNLLLKYAPDGSLADLINKCGGKIPECDVRRYSQMILKGLSSIHNNGYVHCDIKLANILVFLSDQQDLSQLKIADFGLAKSLMNAKEPDEEDSRKFFYQYTFQGTPMASVTSSNMEQGNSVKVDTHFRQMYRRYSHGKKKLD